MRAAGTYIEIWPLAADDDDIHLITPDAVMDGPVTEEGGPAYTVDRLLEGIGFPSYGRRDIWDRPGIIAGRSTSWRWGEPYDGISGTILTFLVAIDVPAGASVPELELVDGDGRPIELQLFGRIGASTMDGPGRWDVLAHGLANLSWLIHNDDAERSLFGPLWRRHLADVVPAASGMYVGAPA